MPTFGGYAPFPAKLGGSGPSIVKGLTQAVGQSRGTAFVAAEGTNVWVENHAIARTIASVWHTNAQLSKSYDLRSTPLLARWEAIFGIVPQPNATLGERHKRLVERRRLTGFVPTRQAIADKLTPILSPIPFVIETQEWNDPYVVRNDPGTWRVDCDVIGAPIPTIAGLVMQDVVLEMVVTQAGDRSQAELTVTWTVGDQTERQVFKTMDVVTIGQTGLTLTCPVGSYALNTHYSCKALVDGWTSSVAHVQVVTTPPDWMKDAEYSDIASSVYGFLDSVLPAWVTFEVVRGDIFRLDVSQNLDRLKLA